MKPITKLKLRRFIGFSLCNAPGTLIELLTLWLLSDVLFHHYFAQFFIAPVIAFECSVIVDFLLFSRFVWRDTVDNTNHGSILRRLLMFNISTAGVYLMRLLLIQILHLIFGLGAVLCDLLSMIFSGLLNFGINDRIIFSKNNGHKPWVHLLMSLVRPFVTLKIDGIDNLPDQQQGPVVYLCNHGFLFGPIAATLNLPVAARPWIDNRVLNIRECTEDLSRMLRRRFVIFGRKIHQKAISKIARTVVSILNDFNPIPVFKNGKREVVQTISQSVEALTNGENLLIFPEQPRRDNTNIATERKDAAQLRSFYSGFVKIGQEYMKRTGQKLQFVPIYINQKLRTMQIAPAVSLRTTGNDKADREYFADELHGIFTRMRIAGR